MSKSEMLRLAAPVLALATLVLSPFLAAAGTLEPRDFFLKDRSSLRFDVPKAWLSKSTPIEKPLGVEIGIDAAPEAPLLIQMMAFQPRTRRETASDLKSMRQLVKAAADQLKNTVVETAVPVRRLNGPDAAGYYISVTNKSPQPGEHKLMAQGIARIGSLHMTFTILSNDASGKIMPAAMAVVRTGRFTKAPPNQASKPTPIPEAHRIAVSKRDGDFYLTVPVSHLAMTIPAKGLKQDAAGKRAGSQSARYFYLHDPGRQLVVSGWFEAAQDYKGARLLWLREVVQFRRKTGDKLKDERFTRIGKWEVIHYLQDTLTGKKLPRAIPNLRAHWVEAGTWIEVHLSLAENISREAADRELEAVLKSIKISRKN